MPKQKKEIPQAKYSKEGLVNSNTFSVTDRDILQIVLKKDKTYTITEAKKVINDFKGGI